MILADTSVWIQHFRESSPLLADLLERDEVAIHPFVIGELACGNLKNRKETLRELEALRRTAVANHFETLEFMERYKLHGKGIGWIDAHLLASCTLSEALLWTRDGRLRRLAQELEIGLKAA
jgi:predicted nucleic acid-binding protein